MARAAPCAKFLRVVEIGFRISRSSASVCFVRTAFILATVFLGGFAVMVLEIVGARYLLKDFGGAFYVWTSQIGVVLVALSAGYYVGGRLADRSQRADILGWLLLCAGVIIAGIPHFAQRLLDWIVLRHPEGEVIPQFWIKVDPALGSAVVFFLPCFVLAMISPYMIRLAAEKLEHVGSVSGKIYAASTVGSVAGVFVSGYFLLDRFELGTIFRSTGLLTMLLGGLCWFIGWNRTPLKPTR